MAGVSIRSAPSVGLMRFETGVGIRVSVGMRVAILEVRFILWPFILFSCSTRDQIFG